MQDISWDDLRVFAAVVETGSFAAAARVLGQHETTVARNVHRLEDRMGQILWRGPEAGVTAEGAVVAEHAAAMAGQAAQARAAMGGQGTLRGAVRLTSVPWLIEAALLPVLPGWQSERPAIAMSATGGHDSVNLLHGEADIALRLARPETGGDVIARKLCDVPFVVAGDGPEWIGYVPEMQHLPQAQWTQDDGLPVGLRLSDQMAVCAAVRAGLGRAWVPRCLGLSPAGPEVRTRPLWCLTHPRTRHAPALRAVVETLLPLVVARVAQ